MFEYNLACFTFCLHYPTRHTRMMIYGCVGQPSHHAIYLVSTNVQKITVITGKTNAPKLDTKTPKKQQVEKNGECVLPTKTVVQPLGL